MKIFISWSGERSRLVANLLYNWLPSVIQSAEVFFSPEDIKRGSAWVSDVRENLNSSDIGIVCLSAENKNKPWILFESGALARGLNSNKVCTFLIDLQPNDIDHPLAQFNHTLPNQEEIRKLLDSINDSLGDRKLRTEVLELAFSNAWQSFESQFAKILSNTATTAVQPVRTTGDLLQEILATVRSMDKRIVNLEILAEKSTASQYDVLPHGFDFKIRRDGTERLNSEKVLLKNIEKIEAQIFEINNLAIKTPTETKKLAQLLNERMKLKSILPT